MPSETIKLAQASALSPYKRAFSLESTPQTPTPGQPANAKGTAHPSPGRTGAPACAHARWGGEGLVIRTPQNPGLKARHIDLPMGARCPIHAALSNEREFADAGPHPRFNLLEVGCPITCPELAEWVSLLRCGHSRSEPLSSSRHKQLPIRGVADAEMGPPSAFVRID
jgi:hypothetical protein